MSYRDLLTPELQRVLDRVIAYARANGLRWISGAYYKYDNGNFLTGNKIACCAVGATWGAYARPLESLRLKSQGVVDGNDALVYPPRTQSEIFGAAYAEEMSDFRLDVGPSGRSDGPLTVAPGGSPPELVTEEVEGAIACGGSPPEGKAP